MLKIARVESGYFFQIHESGRVRPTRNRHDLRAVTREKPCKKKYLIDGRIYSKVAVIRVPDSLAYNARACARRYSNHRAPSLLGTHHLVPAGCCINTAQQPLRAQTRAVKLKYGVDERRWGVGQLLRRCALARLVS